ncbi:MAG: HAD-IB family phosphatase [Verrucomicrobiia bacterium]
MSSVLVTDFDGTMTRNDFYQLARARWWREGNPDPWLEYLDGQITHFDALNRFFARVRGDEASVRAFVREMELDPTLPEALEGIVTAGWRVVIASAGCEWYIRQLLADIKVPFEIHANPGRYVPAEGLQMIPPLESPFYSCQTGIDKVAIVRHALANNSRVAFAGDGPPDLPAAKLVPPERRFARSWLAEALAKEGEAFQPFTTWTGLANRLVGL